MGKIDSHPALRETWSTYAISRNGALSRYYIIITSMSTPGVIIFLFVQLKLRYNNDDKDSTSHEKEKK